MIQFKVFGSPIAQPRARSRAFVIGERPDGTPNIQVRAYEPETVKDKNTGLRKVNPIYEWKQAVKRAALQALGLSVDDLDNGKHPPLMEGPIKMDLTIYFPRPQRLNARKFSDGPIPHISKPDRDNCEKAVLDALKGVIFVDDCQVCDGPVRKFYHEKDGRPRAEIRIETLVG